MSPTRSGDGRKNTMLRRSWDFEGYRPSTFIGHIGCSSSAVTRAVETGIGNRWSRRQSFGITAWSDRMSHTMRILGPKVVCLYKTFSCLAMIYLINRLWKDKAEGDSVAQSQLSRRGEGYEPSFHRKVPACSSFYSELQGICPDWSSVGLCVLNHETLSLVAPNWHRGDCVAKLQKIEKELEQFSEDFGSQLRSLRMSMRNSILSTSEFETWGESCPKNATSKDKHFKLG
uniref:Predicted protein n=1 Tax=Physcomitrium patens TaxID=3218 RepID=A9U4R1_PHYPA